MDPHPSARHEPAHIEINALTFSVCLSRPARREMLPCMFMRYDMEFFLKAHLMEKARNRTLCVFRGNPLKWSWTSSSYFDRVHPGGKCAAPTY